MEDGGAGVSLLMMLIWLVLMVGIAAGMWKTFDKAGKPGWAAIIPIYNLVVLLEVAGKPFWWLVLFLIPLVNTVAAILVSVSVAQSFGKGTGFGLGLAVLPFVFCPILGFGDAPYRGVQFGTAAI